MKFLTTVATAALLLASANAAIAENRRLPPRGVYERFELRRTMNPTSARPASIMAHSLGSGTGVTGPKRPTGRLIGLPAACGVLTGSARGVLGMFRP